MAPSFNPRARPRINQRRGKKKKKFNLEGVGGELTVGEAAGGHNDSLSSLQKAFECLKKSPPKGPVRISWQAAENLEMEKWRLLFCS